MQHDTGLSNAAFAFGAGVFFVGYALFEVPSNLLLHRVGARAVDVPDHGDMGARLGMRWRSRIPRRLSTRCAFCSASRKRASFPASIYYLTHWFPQSSRARALGLFYFGAPLAFIFGSPLSGLLLELHGVFGLAGWQWLFLVEGGLASIVGVWAFWYLDNDPRTRTLARRRKSATCCVARLGDDAETRSAHGPHSMLAALVDRRVLLLSADLSPDPDERLRRDLLSAATGRGIARHEVGLRVGLVTAMPWLCALVVTWFVPRHADRTGGIARWAVALLVLAGRGHRRCRGSCAQPAVSLVALCFAASGFIAAQPLFWTFPTRYLTGAAAAAAASRSSIRSAAWAALSRRWCAPPPNA